MKYLALALAIALAAPAHADVQRDNGHDGGPKAHDGAPGEGDHDGNDRDDQGDPDSVLEGGMCCGRQTPIGTDENGNPSQDTPGLGPDWDPYRDYDPEPYDPDTDWGWGE